MSQPNQSSGSNVWPDWMMLALNAHQASLRHRCPACSWDPMGEEYHRCKWIAAAKAVAADMQGSGQWPAMRPMSDPDLDEIVRQKTRILVRVRARGADEERWIVVYGYMSGVSMPVSAPPRRMWLCPDSGVAYMEKEIIGWWPLPEVPRG